MRSFFPLFLTLLFFSGRVLSFDIPAKPDDYVTDRAGLLSATAKSKLNEALRSFESQTTHQVVVATFPSLDGGSLEDASIRIAQAWKVGQAGQDNGVILLVFRDDRKIRIEVGYGLEGVLTDAQAGDIIRTVIVPQFQSQNYERGILLGTQVILQTLVGEAGGVTQTRREALTAAELEALSQRFRFFWKVILGFAFFLFVFDLIRYAQFKKGHRSYHHRYSFWEWWFRFGILLFLIHTLFKVIFYSMLASRGGSYGSRGGFGGFSGGGGRFGGFSGGGGRFGGGGASGGW